MTSSWSVSVGFLPFKVTARERAPGENVILWWRAAGTATRKPNWKKRSLRRGVRTARGLIDREAAQWVRAQAEALYAKLVRGVPLEDRAPQAPLTLGETRRRLIDPNAGKYPADSAHRREVLRALDEAARIWGADRAWETIRKADLVTLWRARIRALATKLAARNGVRGAEVTVSRVLSIAAWLREEELVPAGACVAPQKWKLLLRADWRTLRGETRDPQVFRPRHSLEEMRGIMAHAHDIDPRFALLMALGAELRLGQVARGRRSDLDLEHKTFTVHATGKKGGTVEKLTPAQMRVVTHALTEGYLAELERVAADYPLFAGGQLAGSRRTRWKDPDAGVRTSKGPLAPTATRARHLNADPIGATQVREWFRAAEQRAGVQHVRGRCTYGLRRAAVDAAKAAGISREGLMAHGGWRDSQIPDGIYAEREQDYAREEARDIRARIRGEETEG